MVATTPWERGRLGAWRGHPKLLFGQMYEDAEVELRAFPASGHVFAIASAGTTSMALAARGLQVTAVDINPAQVAYVRDRLAGGPPRQGTADRLFGIARRLLPLLGIARADLRRFLELQEPAAQLQLWRRHMATRRFRLGLRLLLNPVSLLLLYHPTFLKVVPPRFDLVMRARLERCFAHHPNRTNGYAWRLFLGTDPPEAWPIAIAPERIDVVQADAADYLERCPPGCFAGFALSNILDGTSPAYGDRLMDAVRRSAAARAVLVLRSFAEPPPDEVTEWAIRDRSMLWGLVRVEAVGR